MSEVSFPGMRSIGQYAFENCTSLTELTFPGSFGSLGTNAFKNSGLQSITFESGVKMVSGFKDCTNLQSVTLCEGVETIVASAFENCTNLTEIKIPDSVTVIGKRAFMSCSKLKTVTFGENSQLTTLGESAFRVCSELESIAIPKGITMLDASFAFCTKLAEIRFYGTVEQWNAMSRTTNWMYKVPATQVICKDGNVAIA